MLNFLLKAIVSISNIALRVNCSVVSEVNLWGAPLYNIAYEGDK